MSQRQYNDNNTMGCITYHGNGVSKTSKVDFCVVEVIVAVIAAIVVVVAGACSSIFFDDLHGGHVIEV